MKLKDLIWALVKQTKNITWDMDVRVQLDDGMKFSVKEVTTEYVEGKAVAVVKL